MRSSVLRAITLLACCLVVGCGGPSRPATVPVTLTAIHKGKPAVGALVVMHPVDPAREKLIGGKPFGKVAEDGTLKITTFEEGDGAPEGEYGITVQWNADAKSGKYSLGGEGPSGGDRLGGRFGDPRSPIFKMAVKAGVENKLELKLD